MTHEQNTLMMVAAVVCAFMMAGGASLCSPRSTQSAYDFESDPEYQQMLADAEAIRNPEEPEPARVIGAFYPEDHAEDDSEGGIDPLLLAGVGGGLVFGLVGAAAFLLMGSKREDEAPPTEPAEDVPLVTEDPRS